MGEEVQFSRHALEKLSDATSQQLGLSRTRLLDILKQPECVETREAPVVMAVGKLTSALSLCIVYKFVEGGIRVITFFPARRGRYERNILS